MSETIDHPPHYGGADNVYEAIKVIEAWELGFCLGNAVKYICRAGKKPLRGPVPLVSGFELEEHQRRIEGEKRTLLLEDLKKARWYIDREIQRLEKP